MDITEIVNEKLICLNPKSSNKNEAIREMSRMLKAQNKISDEEEYLEEVREREAISSTNTGIGVAIPHGKGQSVLQTSIAICRFDQGITWDDEPVKIVFLLAVVDNEGGMAHLEVISKISTLLMDDDFLKVLFTVSSEGKLLQEMENRLKEEE